MSDGPKGNPKKEPATKHFIEVLKVKYLSALLKKNALLKKIKQSLSDQRRGNYGEEIEEESDIEEETDYFFEIQDKNMEGVENGSDEEESDDEDEDSMSTHLEETPEDSSLSAFF